MKHLIWIYLDWDRASFPRLDPIWVRERIRIFERFTLASLLNQSFQDFEICLLCGQKNRAITEAHDWDPRVNVLYDRGKEFISKIEDEFLAISRLDSDDLYHKHAVKVIDQAAKIVDKSKELQALVFRKNILWNRISRFLGLHYRMCHPPPFVTRIYPRAIYKDWLRLSSTLFIPHGKMIRGRFTAFDLPKHHVCVVKHGTNFSLVKKNKSPHEHTKEDIEGRIKKGHIFTLDKEGIRKTLYDYGMTNELIDEDPLIFRDGEFRHER